MTAALPKAPGLVPEPPSISEAMRRGAAEHGFYLADVLIWRDTLLAMNASGAIFRWDVDRWRRLVSQHQVGPPASPAPLRKASGPECRVCGESIDGRFNRLFCDPCLARRRNRVTEPTHA